jgi:HEAT repeat protein
MIANTATLLATTASASTRPAPDPSSLDKALTALATYDHGAGRATLMPIDDAVVASLADPAARSALEQRLIRSLQPAPSPVASEYICGKLALIGSSTSVPALVALLADRDRAEPARHALELMPCPEAVQGLRDRLSQLDGTARMGVIHSLGIRRDALSVPEFCLHLHGPDAKTASAAANALGQIGTVSAAGALRESLPKVSPEVRSSVADACLVCAERLASERQPDEARKLWHAVQNAAVPPHVRSAAERALAKLG